jgi:serine/threonine-protein kinase
MFRPALREIVMFLACAVFTGTLGLILLDTVIMPHLVRRHIQVEVPDIVDLSPRQARSRLARYGLRLRTGEARHDPSIPEGRFVFQAPTAFSRVKPGRTVYAVPSLGSRLYEVPKLRGLTLRQAQSAVQQSGLILGEMTEEPHNRVKEGLVSSQSLRVGEEVVRDTPIDLVISTGPVRELVPMPNLVGQTLIRAKKDLASLELRTNVRYEFSTSFLPNTVVRHVPAAGDSVKRGARVELIVCKL